MNEVEHQPQREAEPFEQIFAERYNELLTTASNLVAQLREDGKHHGGFVALPEDRYYEICAAAGPLGLTCARLFEKLGGVFFDEDVARLSYKWKISGATGQRFLVEYLREQHISDVDLDRLETKDWNGLETALERDETNISLESWSPQLRGLLELAQHSGILVPLKQGAAVYAPGKTAQTFTPNELKKHLKFFQAIHASTSVVGVSEGWNKLVLDLDVVRDLFSEEELRRWKKQLRPTTLIDEDGIRDSYLMTPAAQLDRVQPLTKARIQRHGYVEPEFRDATLTALYGLVHELPTQPELPLGIYLAPLSKLLEHLKAKGVEKIHGPVELGFITPAYELSGTSGKGKLHSYRTTENRHYFVALSKTAMGEFKASQQYQTWLKRDELSAMRKEPLEVAIAERGELATYIPKEYQPAYLIRLQAMQEAENVSGVSRGGRQDHTMLAYNDPRDENPYWLFFPNAANARAYKASLTAAGMPPRERVTSMSRFLVEWRMKQLTRLPDWGNWEVLTGAAGILGDVRLASIQEVRAAITSLDPLSVDMLKRRGYLIDAQSYAARLDGGKLIVCPKGKEQSDRIKATTWYQERIKSKKAK